MFCKNCNQEISDNARFCTHCGADQTMMENTYISHAPNPNYAANTTSGDSNDQSSLILLAFTAIWFVGNLLLEILRLTVDEWYVKSYYYIIFVFINLSFLLIPFAIKKMQYKIIAFVIVTPCVLYFLYHNIKGVIEYL